MRIDEDGNVFYTVEELEALKTVRIMFKKIDKSLGDNEYAWYASGAVYDQKSIRKTIEMLTNLIIGSRPDD